MGCCEKNDNEAKFNCPKCSQKGVKVKTITPQTLLKDSYKEKVNPKLVYKYCKTSECDVVYFSENTDHFFVKSELVTKATAKDKGLDVNVCYCFGHTRQSVLDEIKNTGDTTVIEDVKSKMKNPGCFCETSNPQGGCCLANIATWIKSAKESLENKRSD